MVKVFLNKVGQIMADVDGRVYPYTTPENIRADAWAATDEAEMLFVIDTLMCHPDEVVIIED